MERVHVTIHTKMRITDMMKFRASIHITLDKTGASVGHYSLDGTHKDFFASKQK